jgi:DNA-binding HxlR family transcriptional regulator
MSAEPVSGDEYMAAYRCESVGRALEVIGERWTLLILRETMFGVRRYGELARNLSVPRPTLTTRLNKLVDAGLLHRVQYSADPERYEYQLGEAGRALFPVLVVLTKWGDKYLPEPGGPSIVLEHLSCGHDLDVHLVCQHCGDKLTPRTLGGRPGERSE